MSQHELSSKPHRGHLILFCEPHGLHLPPETLIIKSTFLSPKSYIVS